MALFQKKPLVTSSAPLYTIGDSRTKLIIGLGNVGKDYAGTRHNVGFVAVEEFAKANNFPAWLAKKDLKAEITIGNLGNQRVILARPTTLMNRSGQAAQAIQRFYRIYNQDTLVVYDELVIPFGQLRTRLGGSDAGHNGVKSLIVQIGEDFGRLRIGIGSNLAKKKSGSDFVLAKFSKTEQGRLPLILKEASALIGEYIVSDNLNPETRTIV